MNEQTKNKVRKINRVNGMKVHKRNKYNVDTQKVFDTPLPFLISISPAPILSDTDFRIPIL